MSTAWTNETFDRSLRRFELEWKCLPKNALPSNAHRLFFYFKCFHVFFRSLLLSWNFVVRNWARENRAELLFFFFFDTELLSMKFAKRKTQQHFRRLSLDAARVFISLFTLPLDNRQVCSAVIWQLKVLSFSCPSFKSKTINSRSF